MEEYETDIKQILGTVDRQTVSAKQVRQLLEERRKVDLSAHKKDLNALILKCFDETAAPSEKESLGKMRILLEEICK